MWLFASDTTTFQTMIDDLTHRLHNDLGMHKKPKSLQIMSAAHMSRNHRSKITARGSEGHRFPLELCRNMKVLGSWCDDSGGGSSGALSACRVRWCVLPTCRAAEGQDTTHGGKNHRVWDGLHILGATWLRNSTPGLQRSQKVGKAGKVAVSEA